MNEVILKILVSEFYIKENFEELIKELEENRKEYFENVERCDESVINSILLDFEVLSIVLQTKKIPENKKDYAKVANELDRISKDLKEMSEK